MNQIEATTHKTLEGLLHPRDCEMLSDAVDLDVLRTLDDSQNAGESDLVVELIDLYVADASSKMAAIQNALRGAEWPLLKRAAHNLEGSSATLGAKQMAVLCRDLQRLDSARPTDRSRTLLSRLDDEFCKVLMAFAAERERRVS
jgi:HPt (histidine-containing phosphotransfer) domain-containing protein